MIKKLFLYLLILNTKLKNGKSNQTNANESNLMFIIFNYQTYIP